MIIILIVNKEDVYEKWLKRSLIEQVGCNYQLEIIDNTRGKYKSLYAAYQSVLKEEKRFDENEILFFCHPDISFDTKDELKRLKSTVESVFNTQKNVGVIGVAGITGGEYGKGITTIRHGNQISKNKCEDLEKNKYVIVQTVDACAYFIKAETLKKIGFNKENKSFHLLIEEYSLRLHNEGYDTVVISANIYHFSPGSSLDYHYYQEMKNVARLHKEYIYINTTSFRWRNGKCFPLKMDYLTLRNYIHHKLKGDK